MITEAELLRLQSRGWSLTRDGSTATARLWWDDPDEPGAGWNMVVLHTAGHESKFVMEAEGSALYERTLADVETLRAYLEEAVLLLREWQGETTEGEAGNEGEETE